MFYIGNTQQNYKSRMSAHYNDVKKLFDTDKRTDTYAQHFAVHLGYNPSVKKKYPGPPKLRELAKFEILWQGDPIKVVKTFGKRSCVLCTQERLAIIKAAWKNCNQLINSNSEIYGACCHNPKFHRFKENNPPSTDDRIKHERVNPPLQTRVVPTSMDPTGSTGGALPNYCLPVWV